MILEEKSGLRTGLQPARDTYIEKKSEKKKEGGTETADQEVNEIKGKIEGDGDRQRHVKVIENNVTWRSTKTKGGRRDEMYSGICGVCQR